MFYLFVKHRLAYVHNNGKPAAAISKTSDVHRCWTLGGYSIQHLRSSARKWKSRKCQQKLWQWC